MANFKLQNLRIPGGWEVIINKFLDVDVTQYSSDDTIWRGFTENILHIRIIYVLHKRFYSIFCICSLMSSNCVFISITPFVISKLFAFEPIVFTSLLIS